MARHYNKVKEIKGREAAEVIAMHQLGMSKERIARATKRSIHSIDSVCQTFKRVSKNLPKVAAFREGKADILAAAQITALESAFSEAKINKASFDSTIKAFDILNKAERLERNLSTENTSHAHLGTVSLRVDQPVLPPPGVAKPPQHVDIVGEMPSENKKTQSE